MHKEERLERKVPYIQKTLKNGGLSCYEINLSNTRNFPQRNMKFQCYLWHCTKKTGDDLGGLELQ